MKIDITKKYTLTKITSISEVGRNSDIHDGYWAEGKLADIPSVGEKLMIYRDSNSVNPDGKYGIFYSSPVQDLNHQENSIEIKTQNSIYKLEEY